MRVIYHKGALRDINSVFGYIAKDDPAAAGRAISRIRAVAALLADSPYLGRPGRRGLAFYPSPDCLM